MENNGGGGQMKFTIREVKMKDAKDLMEYINELVEEKAELTINKKVTLRQEKEWLKKALKEIKKKQKIMLVVEVDGKVVGNAEARKYEGTASHVVNLGIRLRKKYRGKGIGTTLLKKLIKEVKTRFKDVEIIHLGVYATNQRAMHVYEKIGFRRVATLPKWNKVGDRYIDAIQMYLVE